MAKLRAKDYRRIAREKLSDHLGIAIIVSIIASILGVSNGVNISLTVPATSTSSFDAEMDGIVEDLNSVDFEIMLESVLEFLLENPAVLAFLATMALIISLSGLINFVLGGPTKAGYCQYNINLVTGTSKFEDLFAHYKIFLRAFLVKLLVKIFLFLWHCLLIVPGIIMRYAYAMTFYILAEHPDMKPIEAIKSSRRMMKGHKWQLFCLKLSFIGWEILSAFTCGIGSLFLTPYKEAAKAAFYKNISSDFFAVANENKAKSVNEEKLLEE